MSFVNVTSTPALPDNLICRATVVDGATPARIETAKANWMARFRVSLIFMRCLSDDNRYSGQFYFKAALKRIPAP